MMSFLTFLKPTHLKNSLSSDISAFGRLQQFAVRRGIGIGFTIYVFRIVISDKVIYVLVIGSVHVGISTWNQVVMSEKK